MENGLLYILAFSAMAVALFACVLPQIPLYAEIEGVNAQYNYLIYQSGSLYNAMSSSGAIAVSSTLFNTTLQEAINALDTETHTGGIIYIKSGVYTLPAGGGVSIATTNKGVTIKGESPGWNYSTRMGTLIQAGSGFGNNPMITVNGQFSWIEDIGIDGLSIAKGILLNTADAHVINTNIAYCTVGLTMQSANYWIQNNWIEYCTTYGIESGSCEDQWIQNNMFYNNGYEDLALHSTTLDAKDIVWIQNNRFYGSQRAIDTWGLIKNLIVTNNKFYGLTSAGLRFENNVTHVLIEGNTLEGATVTDNFIKIESGVTIEKMNLIANSIIGNTSVAINNLGTITTLNNVYNFGV